MMALKIVFNHFNEPVEPFPARVFNGIPALDCTLRSELIILNGENQNSEKKLTFASTCVSVGYTHELESGFF